ncbi:TBCC-domain-containing protein [Auriculariales sp. MPI-PUGE-AT-0066]|nr:TBCC-domain-containing protein [Auriculariales sp. MPI-PUGE-AT-0066]
MSSNLIADFFGSFKTEHESLVARLNAANPDITSVQLDAARLRRKLTEATEYLPAYDQRKYNSQLKSLEDELAKRGPKQRFGFKRKEPATTTATTSATSTPRSATAANPSPAPVAPAPAQSVSASVLNLRDLVDTVIDASYFAVSSSESPSELTISSLTNCIIDLRQGINLASVHANNLRRVVLLLPQIQGSILVDDCINCVLATACHQFRMHKTTDTDVHLHISSMPVIEHCTGIRFTAYPFGDPSASATPSQHFTVQDFDWILPEPSPNWTRMDDSKGGLFDKSALMNISDASMLEQHLQQLLPPVRAIK